MPRTANVLPRRAKLRRLSELPKFTKSTTDILEPKRDIPNNDAEDESRTKLRRENELPK